MLFLTNYYKSNMADETLRYSWENNSQWKARLQFMKAWESCYPADRLTCLSTCWANVKFLGCSYPAEVESLVHEMESKCECLAVSSQEFEGQRSASTETKRKSQKKPETFIENLTIYEPAEDDLSSNAVSILFESAQKSKKNILFEESTCKSKLARFSCAVILQNKFVATGEAASKKDAKRVAAENALEVLRTCQPVVKKRKIDHEAAPNVNKTELTKKAYVEAPSIPEENLGNQMLRKMGWTGSGGIGKQGQGRAEPVMVTGVEGKLGLGGSSTASASLHRGSVQKVLMDFLNGREQDIKFSSELSKEERAIIHKLSQQYGLKSHSHGKGDSRYLMVSKK